jgi:hypothetical protein
MAFGGLITSLSTPVLAQRVADQRLLVAPAVIVTAVGMAGALYAPLGSEVIWMLVLGAAQGAALGLAIFFTMARAPDPGTAASLSSLAQAVGYLVAAAGPLAVGFLHTATGGWTVPIVVLIVICVAEMYVGLLAGRAKVLPAAGVPGNPDAVGAVPADKLTPSDTSIMRGDDRCAESVRMVRYAESPATMTSRNRLLRSRANPFGPQESTKDHKTNT